ncbi:hypothetical protein BDW22DRAFT_1339238, partial [Trametopsis cervina]
MSNIWSFGSYTKKGFTDGGRTRVPALQFTDLRGVSRLTENNQEKSATLHRAFFPMPGPGPDPTQQLHYPEPAFEFDGISTNLIRDVLNALKRYKAAGTDDIPNEVYANCAEILLPYLHRLYEATFRLKVYPAEWRISRTVVLRKPGRKDYTTPNSYRPIALLPCIAKILAACVTKIITNHCERSSLLSNNHFLG